MCKPRSDDYLLPYFKLKKILKIKKASDFLFLFIFLYFVIITLFRTWNHEEDSCVYPNRVFYDIRFDYIYVCPVYIYCYPFLDMLK